MPSKAGGDPEPHYKEALDPHYTVDDRMAGVPDQIAMATVCLEQGDLEGAESYLSDVLANVSASAYARSQAGRLLEHIARHGLERRAGKG